MTIILEADTSETLAGACQTIQRHIGQARPDVGATFFAVPQGGADIAADWDEMGDEARLYVLCNYVAFEGKGDDLYSPCLAALDEVPNNSHANKTAKALAKYMGQNYE